ncbi:MAG: uracil-DNA glycosylase [Alphaproteobacteria bacterium]|jgi:uracil-DNA glycosylase|nr:uracil-DNA glycosylase [Alphaproteobacteria bacterium]
MYNLSNINNNWNDLLQQEKSKDYFNKLELFLNGEETVFPPSEMVFNALSLTPPENVKIVILGQDPYHDNGQAMGLSFSVPDNIKSPPSLKNIFREIEQDLGILMPDKGDLTNWAKQGVLLLNTVLTVLPHTPQSHKNKGWEIFTDEIIHYINNNLNNVVFMLWGGYAKKKSSLIDNNKHLILTANHPSPLSANRGGWFGCKHFSQANEYLKEPINWDYL